MSAKDLPHQPPGLQLDPESPEQPPPGDGITGTEDPTGVHNMGGEMGTVDNREAEGGARDPR